MITVRNLVKRMGSQEVLKGVDLEVHDGETLVVVGRSGCGKSVLLRHLVGLLQPTSGEVLVDGENIVGLDERQLAAIRRKVGILFQGGALFDSMTVEENVAFPLREQGVRDPAELRRRVDEAIEVVDLAGTGAKMPDALSGGMRKRVALARSIIGSPSHILYDEPTTGLDPVVSDSINHLIRRLQKRLRVTSVVVTHDMKSAFHVADRVAYLHEGKIYFLGSVDALRASTDPQILDFIEGRSGETDE